MNATRCHTYLEIIYVRYGALAHVVFVFFALVTNILVGSQLLLGGSAVLTSLTGMNVYAAIVLIPTGVASYVLLGGLRATFLCDYSHTLILMVIILYFMFKTYAEGSLIGSPSRMYELLKDAAVQRPVADNQDGSYMTLKSNGALVFGIIQLCSGSGTVFLDQAYWQRAIASRPETAVKAYILGGIAWFAIPFGFATTLGLAAVALTDNPVFPTYPTVPTSADISAGLASAYAASALLGTSGAVALLITLFMAVTSCASAELIAVSSILTFDVFKTYVRPKASPKTIMLVAHINVCVFAAVMAIFAIIWHVAGIDLGWLFLVMGLLIGGAVFPVAFSICWKKQTRAGAVVGALLGLVAGIAAWLAEAKVYYGEITLTTTGANYPTLAGNLAAIMTGLIVTTVVSLIKPDDFDWEITRAINSESIESIQGQAPEESKQHSGISTAVASPAESDDEKSAMPEKGVVDTAPVAGYSDDLERRQTIQTATAPSLRSAYKLAIISSIVLPFIMDFLIPIPMFLSHYVFSKGFLTAWIVISFMWVFGSAIISCVLPIWETRDFLKQVSQEIWCDVRRKRSRRTS